MEFRILGPLEVSDGGSAVELRGPKVRALMAMLVLHANEAVSTDRLVEALWPDQAPDTAAGTLQTYVSQLRKAIGADGADVVLTRSPGYLLAVEPARVDALRFEKLLVDGREALRAGHAAAAAALLRDALALWRGPPLVDFAFSPFAAADIHRLAELRVTAQEEHAEAELALGHHAEVGAELGRLVGEHPLRERLWSLHMLALYRCGRQADALRTYGELRRGLGEELGIEPSLPLQRLEQGILLQEPALDWHASTATASAAPIPAPRSHNLPTPRTTFVGRTEEATELQKLLATSSLVTVVGPGGSGKTRLAVEVARSILPDHPGGSWFVELAQVVDPALVPDAMAAALGVRDEPGRALLETLADALGDQDVLLVFDNCEHLVEAAAALIDSLLKAAPALTVLATSREPLRVDGEVLWRIPSLAAPGDDSLPADALASYDAVRLFVDRATAHGGFGWTPANAAAVARICRRLDGLPLALELAAARVGVLSPSQIGDRLDDRFALLTGGPRTVLLRHQTLRAAVNWSHDLLPEPERTLFRRLSVFAGGFSLAAVEEVSAGDGLEAAPVLDVLAGLVDRSLVTTSERDGEARYGLHETLRAYGAEQLAEAGEEHMLVARHLSWVTGLVKSFEAAQGGPDVPLLSARVDLEHDNVRRALGWAITEDPHAALAMVGALTNFWAYQGHISEGRRWAEAALEAAVDPPLKDKAIALRCAGWMAYNQGDIGRARYLLDGALAVFRSLGDKANAASVLTSVLAPMTRWQGEVRAARQMCEEGLALAREAGAERSEAWALGLLGLMACDLGEFQQARLLLAESVELFTKLGNERDLVNWQLNEAWLDVAEGDNARARPALEQALAAQRRFEDRFVIPNTLEYLGNVLLRQGDLEGAESAFEEQLERAREMRIQGQAAGALAGLGRVALRRGDLQAARSSMSEALVLVSKCRKIHLPEFIEGLACVASAEGRCERAAELFGAADAIRQTRGTPVSPAGRLLSAEGLATAQAGLDPVTLAEAWARGGRLSAEEAVSIAVAGPQAVAR